MRKPTMAGIILAVVCASAGACTPLDLSGDLEVSLNGEWCFMLNGPKKEQEGDDAYRLTSDSPCIDSGSIIPDNGGLDFWGNRITDHKPDIGAHERSGMDQR